MNEGDFAKKLGKEAAEAKASPEKKAEKKEDKKDKPEETAYGKEMKKLEPKFKDVEKAKKDREERIKKLKEDIEETFNRTYVSNKGEVKAIKPSVGRQEADRERLTQQIGEIQAAQRMDEMTMRDKTKDAMTRTGAEVNDEGQLIATEEQIEHAKGEMADDAAGMAERKDERDEKEEIESRFTGEWDKYRKDLAGMHPIKRYPKAIYDFLARKSPEKENIAKQVKEERERKKAA